MMVLGESASLATLVSSNKGVGSIMAGRFTIMHTNGAFEPYTQASEVSMAAVMRALRKLAL